MTNFCLVISFLHSEHNIIFCDLSCIVNNAFNCLSSLMLLLLLLLFILLIPLDNHLYTLDKYYQFDICYLLLLHYNYNIFSSYYYYSFLLLVDLLAPFFLILFFFLLILCGYDSRIILFSSLFTNLS